MEIEEDVRVKLCLIVVENNLTLTEFLKESIEELDETKMVDLNQVVQYCRIKLYLNEPIKESMGKIKQLFLAEKDAEIQLNAILVLIEESVRAGESLMEWETVFERNIGKVENVVYWLGRLKAMKEKYCV